MTEFKPIRFADKGASVIAMAELAEQPILAEKFAALAKLIVTLHPSGRLWESVNIVAAFLETVVLLDGNYGQDGELPIEGAADAADESMRAVADLQANAPCVGVESIFPALDSIAIGIGLWCMRHQLAIFSPEPVVNALARRANESSSKQEMAATYALMQGFVLHLAPFLKSDLERSNPERPWRILNVNFAISAIRTGDTKMMRYAFDCLNMALPAERVGFYAEALVLASQPGFPAETRALIEQEHRQFNVVP